MFGFLKNIFYRQDNQGNHLYSLNQGSCNWANHEDVLKMALEHPILNPAINYIAKAFASAEFFIENKKGELTKDHELIRLLDNPNPDQSKNEFLENYIWFRYVFGYVYQYMKFESGFKKGSIYNLEPNYITFSPNYKTKMLFSNEVREGEFVYDNYNEKLTISLQDCMIFYDLPNGIGCNSDLTKAPSRLSALRKPIETIQMAYDSKNTIIPQNGDRLISYNGSIEYPMDSKEKEEIQNNANNNYGLGAGRVRTMVTGANIKVESLHIPLSDLGLDESIIKDAEKIIIGLGLPTDALKYDPKKSTFENQKNSKIDFYQNVVYNIMNDFTGNYTKTHLEGTNLKLVAKYDHLPLFQQEKEREVSALNNKLEAFSKMMEIGIDKNEALKLAQLNELTINDKISTNE